MSRDNRNRTRAQAAKICAIAASGGVAVQSWPPTEMQLCREYGVISSEIGASASALNLAHFAWDYVISKINSNWTCEIDAEAEALIRDGWSP